MADLNNDGVVDAKDVEMAKSRAVEAAGAASEKAQAAYAKAKEAGFFSHFSEYNQEILTPFAQFKGGDFKEQLLSMKDDALATLMLTPKEPKAGFILYNVLALVLGIAESLIFGLFGHGFISLLWNGAFGYACAYTMYWTMTCYDSKLLRFYTLCFLGLYVVFNVYMTLHTLIWVLPAALYGTKAAVDVLQFICGFKLYKELAGDQLIPTALF